MRSYGLAVHIASSFNSKAKLWVNGRKDWRNQLSESLNGIENPIWFHAASVGEFEQGRPIIEKLKTEYPDIPIVLSFFSPSGYEMNKDYRHADLVCYLPLDSPSNARDFISILKPQFAVFVRYEFWFYFLRELNNRNIPTYLISAVFRPDQHFFKGYGKWFRKPLSWYQTIFVQDERSKDLLASIAINQVKVSGDSRIDRVLQIVEADESFSKIEKFKGSSRVLIVGSSWDKEDEFILQLLKEDILPLNWKVIIAPHEISESKIENLQASISLETVRYSELDEEGFNARVLIADGYGYLSRIYKYADIGLIGGGFKDGIHSTLEPAAFGMPLYFGPHNKSFVEAQLLQDAGIAKEVNTYQDFAADILKYLSDLEELDRVKMECRNYIRSLPRATSVIYPELKNRITSL